MQTISDTLSHLHLGAATAFEGMTVFPLFSDQLRDKDYLTLDEALEQGQARVIEVSEEGEVPNLLFENLGSRKVLLVDGDELVGAKQNRIVNLSILVGGAYENRDPGLLRGSRALVSQERRVQFGQACDVLPGACQQGGGGNRAYAALRRALFGPVRGLEQHCRVFGRPGCRLAHQLHVRYLRKS